ncbi:MAG TPA: ADP-ribosylation family protein [Chthonomonadaceae bacterium]|nr:ADP-ribosylation family protein [Chthonomonadaceae bacterium]
MVDRQQELKDIYGFDFPEDFFAFWEFAKQCNPEDPRHAFSDSLGLTLVGPYDVLAGRFDGKTPRYSSLLHWRYRDDPPEFFTILCGDTDKLHWGYWLDDPAQGPSCIAHYYANDAYELTEDCLNLFELFRQRMEDCYVSTKENKEDDPEYAADYNADLREYRRLRRILPQYGKKERPEIGQAYLDKYESDESVRPVVAKTLWGMGIVVAPEQYRPPKHDTEQLLNAERSSLDMAEWIQGAREACEEGYPGTALKLGRDLWPFEEESLEKASVEILDMAYTALNRPLLHQVLQVHNENRWLQSVDILHEAT